MSPKTFRKPVQNVSLDILFLDNVILNTSITSEKLFQFFKQRYLHNGYRLFSNDFYPLALKVKLEFSFHNLRKITTLF